MFTQFKDPYGLLEDEKCGEVEYKLEVIAIQLPESILVLDGYSIILNGTDALDYIGTYQAKLIVNILEYDQIYEQKFKFAIQKENLDSEDEINEEINQPPYFQGYEGINQHELPPTTIEVGQSFFYPFPVSMDRDDDDIEIRVETGNQILENCGDCYQYDVEA